MPMSKAQNESPALVSGGGAGPAEALIQQTRHSIQDMASGLKALATRLDADEDGWADNWECPPGVEGLGIDLAGLVAAGPDQVRRFASALEVAGAVARSDERDVRRAIRRVQQNAPAVMLPPLIDAADFWAGPAPSVDWVLPGVLPAGEVALLVGSDGAGKSVLALELALAVALGVPWACRAPDPGQPWTEPWLLPASTPGRVLYLGGEDDKDEYHRCTTHIAATLGLPAPGPAQLVMLPLDAQPLHLMRAGRQQATPEETPAADALRALIVQLKPRLIVLDPLIMFHALAENDPQHMDSVMRLIIRLARSVPGCAALMVHHAGQDAVRGGQDDHMLGRGSTGLGAAARAVFTVRKPTDRESSALEELGLDASLWRRLRGPKISRGPQKGSVWLSFHGRPLVAEDPPVASAPAAQGSTSRHRAGGSKTATRGRQAGLTVLGGTDDPNEGRADCPNTPVGFPRSRLEWADDDAAEEVSPDGAE